MPLSSSLFFFFNDTATTEIYTLSLHDALPISQLFHRANKFMPRNAAKVVIAVQQLHVGIADAHEPHADECPARAQFRHRPRCCFQFSIFNVEGEHGCIVPSAGHFAEHLREQWSFFSREQFRPTNYSYRRATIGSTRIARRAGM